MMDVMDDLIAFLRARLDDDEQTARRVGDSFRQIGETGVIVATEGDRAEECAAANWAGIAEHIVRHDPARVLAEVDAKRRIIDEIVPKMNDMEDAIDGEWGVGEGPGEYESTTLLRLLALSYASHPDYQDTWRP